MVESTDGGYSGLNGVAFGGVAGSTGGFASYGEECSGLEKPTISVTYFPVVLRLRRSHRGAGLTVSPGTL